MFLIDKLLLLGGALTILAVVSSRFSARFGLPVLLLFLGVGMLAGSDGIGKIAFEDYGMAHAIGTIALALILFDGGLRTPVSNLRDAARPALLLATLGVVVTAGVTGLVAALVLGLSPLEGLLLGGIVGSTDAAAVFSQLRTAGVRLRKRLASTLEVESGANDPMAVFLTVGLIQVLTGEMELGLGLVSLFVTQMGVGLAVGYAVGRLSAELINRIHLPTSGLYPVLTAACGLFAFGLAAVLQGSGFLAVYVAGIVLGNRRVVFQRGTRMFNDGLAWAAQVFMFVVLGLLSFPHQLVEVAAPGVAIALVLTLVARPLAVLPLAIGFGFSARELAMLSWVGLKGAVPIILATYPMLAGLSAGPVIFNVVFFVVLVSALLQGTSLAWVARLLGVKDEGPGEGTVSLELVSLRDVDADIAEYVVPATSSLVGRALRDIPLPDGAVIAVISRNGDVVAPRGTTQVEPGDHVFVVVKASTRDAVEAIFAGRGEPLIDASPALSPAG